MHLDQICKETKQLLMNTSPQTYPSIFNDVIGPVMRGPSSSHCAAAVRIGRMVRDLMDGEITDVSIEFDPHGSLATTHASQGSDMGLFAGLLGWDATDARLPDSAQAIQAAGIHVNIEITPIAAVHPNTYKMKAVNSRETHTITAISTGGGIIEVLEIDGAALSLAGDYYETLLFYGSDGDRLLAHLKASFLADEICLRQALASQFVEIKSQAFLEQALLSQLRSGFDLRSIKQIRPVLPVLSRRQMQVPFLTCADMLAYDRDKHLSLSELAVHYECARGALRADQVLQNMAEIIDIMQAAIRLGSLRHALCRLHPGLPVRPIRGADGKRRFDRCGRAEPGHPVHHRLDGIEERHGPDRGGPDGRFVRRLARRVHRRCPTRCIFRRMPSPGPCWQAGSSVSSSPLMQLLLPKSAAARPNVEQAQAWPQPRW